MSPAEQHGGPELNSLLDLAMVVEDRDVADQLIRIIRAMRAVQDLHNVDAQLRCLLCRPSDRRIFWRRRQLCTVREVFEDCRLDVSVLRVAQR